MIGRPKGIKETQITDCKAYPSQKRYPSNEHEYIEVCWKDDSAKRYFDSKTDMNRIIFQINKDDLIELNCIYQEYFTKICRDKFKVRSFCKLHVRRLDTVFNIVPAVSDLHE